MKKRLSILMLGAVIAFSSCSKYDDSELRGRIESLETWQATVNSQISSLQSIVSALETKDHVTSVTPHSDGTGYVINFEKSDAVTIKHGEKGDAGVSPIIGAKQDTDGKYYWTINGEWLLDNDAKIPTTGDKGNNGNNGNDGADGKDVIAPQVRINQTTGEWEVSTNGGTTWTTTGVKAQGDAIFAKNGVDNTNTDYVEFTLADETTKIKVPKVSAISITFDSYDTFVAAPANNEMELLLPSGFKQSDFAAIKAQISNAGGDNNAVVTRSVVEKWSVSISQPIFESGEFVEGSLKVKISPASTAAYGEKAILKVTLVDAAGKEYSTSRIVTWFDGTIAYTKQGRLSEFVQSPGTVTKLMVVGDTSDPINLDMNEEDFKFIRENMPNLEILDLSLTDIEYIPFRGLAFYGGDWGLSTNYTIKEIVLPESLLGISNSAFAMCASLEKINIPASVRSIGRWMFEGNEKLTSIEIPEGVTLIPQSAFYGMTGLTTMTIPSTVTSIGNWAFENCENLKDINIPSKVTSIGSWVFNGCNNLESIILPEGLTTISEGMFYCASSLKTVNIPSTIEIIEDDAFVNCNIETLIIPSRVKTIGKRAFSMTSVTSIIFSEGLKKIDVSAFANCTKVTEVILPASLEEMSDCAFYWTKKSDGSADENIDPYVRKLTFKSLIPPVIIYNDYKPNVRWMDNCKVYVPATAIDAYKTSIWLTGTTTPYNISYFNESNLSAIPD